jgi:hypothetical protein
MKMMECSPLQHYTKTWSSLVQNCKAHGENKVGKRATNALIDVGQKRCSHQLAGTKILL